MRKILLFISVVLCHSAFCQGDTVRYRSVISTLSDASTFFFEIGSLELKKNSNKTFLRFKEPEDNTSPETFFKSANFTVSASTDSLRFYKVAFFDNQDYLEDTVTEGTAGIDSIMSKAVNRYGLDFAISPLNAHFSFTSYLKYIVEICKASNGSVVDSYDTLKCYKNGSGQLKYMNYPPSYSVRQISLSAVPIDTPVYLSVRREYSLPINASFTSHACIETPNNVAATDAYVTGAWVQTPAPIHSVVDKADDNNVTITPNPSHGVFVVSIRSSIEGALRVALFNSLGQKVFEENKSVITGLNNIQFTSYDLPSGSYSMYVYAPTGSYLKNLIVSN